jgi:hypothetical protein
VVIAKVKQWLQVRRTKRWLTVLLRFAFEPEIETIRKVFKEGNLSHPVVAFVLGYLFGAAFMGLKMDVGQRRRLEDREVLSLFWDLVSWLVQGWPFQERNILTLRNDANFEMGLEAAEKEISLSLKSAPGFFPMAVTSVVLKHKL